MNKKEKQSLSRRKFIARNAAAASAFTIAPGQLLAGSGTFNEVGNDKIKNQKPDWKPGDPIGYIRSVIPEYSIPPYNGIRYNAFIPDTLELQERARLAVNALTEPTDPLSDNELFWLVDFRTNPPQLHGKHQFTKFWEALPLMRMISGSTQNMNVENKWTEVLLKSIGPDGLYYVPRHGRPWDKSFPDLVRFGASPDIDQRCDPFENGRLLSAMCVMEMRDGGGFWKEPVRKMVDGLIELALYEEDIAGFWPSPFLGFKVRPKEAKLPTESVDAESSRVPHGLTHAYKLIGYEPALQLAGKIIRYMRRYFYGPDGSFQGTIGQPQAHFHAHSHGLLSMAEYAEVTEDKELMEFVIKGFNWAKSYGENNVTAEGYRRQKNVASSLLGYFVEWTNCDEWEGSETCQVGDMISLALILSEAGAGDYWDDADRWIRNMLAEGQATTTDWMNRVHEHISHNISEWKILPTALEPNNATIERVAERNLGAFAGWAAPNDFTINNGPGIMHCCTANGSIAIYRAWDRIIRYQDGKLRVNLLLNRGSQWADINSHIPYQGQIDIKIKVKADLLVRIPEWVKPAETRCQVNGKERIPGWEGRYAKVGDVKPGDVATVTFPISERIQVGHIEKERFSFVIKGNEVVNIDPPGRHCPLFNRRNYRENSTRWYQAERFVYDKVFHW